MSGEISIRVTSKIDIPRVLRNIDDDTFWTFAANEWHKLISPFTPMDTGNLYSNVEIQPKQIHYQMEYAPYVYESNANFRKDLHPLASREWDQAAIAAGKDKELIDAMTNYIKSKRLKFD